MDQYKRKNDTVIILGTAETLKVVPWNEPDTDYWACQPVITYPVVEGKRIDLLFEMHKPEYYLKDEVLERINKSNIPTYMVQAVPQIPKSITYPLKEIQEWVKHPKLKRFFSSTISYMIAFALYSGYKFIELYGVHMSHEEEKYSIQRNSCEAWLNYGLGLGVDYWIPDQSSIMALPYMYGYEQEKDILLRLMNYKESLHNGVVELNKQRVDFDERYWQQVGAEKACFELINQFKGS